MKAQFARIATLLCATACLTALPARAVIPISVTFDIGWTNGGLVGTQSTGTFEYDFSAITGTFHEEVGPGYGLRSLDIMVGGQRFTMDHDSDPAYPEFPKAFFTKDVFNGFDYIGFVNPSFELNLFELGVGKGGAYFSDGNFESIGDISFRPFTTPQRPKPGEPVPDAGATAGLLGVALLALAALRRRVGNGGQLHLDV